MEHLSQRALTKAILADSGHDNLDFTTVNNINRYNDKTKIEKLVKYIDDLEKSRARSTFAMVLIDGDGMNFHHDLVKEGIQGGDRAAETMMDAAHRALRHDEDFKYDEKIFVKVYANLKGLANAYSLSREELDGFVIGFNKKHF